MPIHWGDRGAGVGALSLQNVPSKFASFLGPLLLLQRLRRLPEAFFFYMQVKTWINCNQMYPECSWVDSEVQTIGTSWFMMEPVQVPERLDTFRMLLFQSLFEIS